MFDFEKFPVYIQTEEFIKEIQPIFKAKYINIHIKDQLYRASASIMLNISEGAGKNKPRDKRNFYSIARGSTQECVSIIKILRLEDSINEDFYIKLYERLTLIAKMLSGLIKQMSNYADPK